MWKARNCMREQINCEVSTSHNSPLVSHFLSAYSASWCCSVIACSVPVSLFFLSRLWTLRLKRKVLWMHLHGCLSLCLSVTVWVCQHRTLSACNIVLWWQKLLTSGLQCQQQHVFRVYYEDAEWALLYLEAHCPPRWSAHARSQSAGLHSGRRSRFVVLVQLKLDF